MRAPLIGYLALVATLVAGCQTAPAATGSPAVRSDASAAPRGTHAQANGQPAAEPALLGVTMAHAGLTPNVAAVWVAADLDFDRQYGLDINIVQTRTASLSQAALLSGEVDYAWTGLGPTLAARDGGSDVVFIAATQNRAAGDLVVHSSITTPEALRGKRLGVHSLGGPPHLRTLQALASFGLDPERDQITILATGEEPTTAAALLEGAIDGAALSYTAASGLKPRGYRSWDLAELGIPDVFGIVTRPGQARAKAEETRRLLRALGASLAYIQTIGGDEEARQRVAQVLAERLRAPREDVLVHLDRVKDHLPADMRVQLDDATEVQTYMVGQNPAVGQVHLDEVLDYAFLDQIR